MNESCHTYERNISDIRSSQATLKHGSRRTYERVISLIHVTFMNESCMRLAATNLRACSLLLCAAVYCRDLKSGALRCSVSQRLVVCTLLLLICVPSS